jgi:hypothetical protein
MGLNVALANPVILGKQVTQFSGKAIMNLKFTSLR